jgi:ankyrin repeat protein
VEIVRHLVEWFCEKLSNKNINQRTAADEARVHGHKEIFELLRTVDFFNTILGLEIDDFSEATPKSDKVPFVNAYYGKLSLVQAMLAGGKAINNANSSGETALIWAAENGYLDIVEELLAVPGIEIDKANQKGETALMVAAAKGNLSVVQTLVQKGTVAKMEKAQSALFIAAQNGQLPVIQWLVSEGGANINALMKIGIAL